MAQPYTKMQHGEAMGGAAALPQADAAPRRSRFAVPALLQAGELAVLAGGALVAAQWTGGRAVLSPLQALFVALAATIGFALLARGRGYEPELLLAPRAHLRAVLWADAALLAALAGFALLSGAAAEFDPAWLAAWAGLALAGQGTARGAATLGLRRQRARGALRDRIAVFGANAAAGALIDRLARSDRFEIVGVFDDRLHRIPRQIHGVPVAGISDDLIRQVRRNRIDRIVVTLPWAAEARLRAMLTKLSNVPVEIELCPDPGAHGLDDPMLSLCEGLPLLRVNRNPHTDWAGVAKRAEDIVLAAAALFALAPLMVLIALAIRLDSPGPVLFRQRRYGHNNQVIEVFKFRSMTHRPAEESDVPQARRDDPRVTRVGAVLRRWSLDELPQVFNVLRGEMSVVGPRPHAVPHNLKYARLIETYEGRHNVKPGITGWAQVNGLRGETDTVEKMSRRVEHDLYYIRHWSLWLDLKIVLRTAVAVLRRDNAY
ncbi:MAG TPA: undecaprenyl-phosphate glucose phosphotransferase [Alphaproteobacteria bacterium]|nr:undecaprenyl-phosphate glucose phosphotransferase [Alphaproteobacteria bacterium]